MTVFRSRFYMEIFGVPRIIHPSRNAKECHHKEQWSGGWRYCEVTKKRLKLVSKHKISQPDVQAPSVPPDKNGNLRSEATVSSCTLGRRRSGRIALIVEDW